MEKGLFLYIPIHLSHLLLVVAFTGLLGGCAASNTRTRVAVQPSLVTDDKESLPEKSLEVIPRIQVDAELLYGKMVYYITPKVAAPITTSELFTAYVDYPASSTTLSHKYKNNQYELAHLRESLLPLLQGRSGMLRTIYLTGYASPDGSLSQNEALSARRAMDFKQYLKKEYNQLPEIKVNWVAEDWAGLSVLVGKSTKEYRGEVVRLLSSDADSESLKKKLKALNNGKTWKDMQQSFFSRLRKMELRVEFASLPEKEPIQTIEQIYEKLDDSLTIDQLYTTAALYRPGSEEYRETYELAAYRFPTDAVSGINAATASLIQGDSETARHFLTIVSDDSRALFARGVLALQDGDMAKSESLFKEALPLNPRLAQANLKIVSQIKASLLQAQQAASASKAKGAK